MPEPQPLRFRPDDLTVGDLEDFEEITGAPFMETLAKLETGAGVAGLTAKVLKALVFVIKRGENPDFTIDDARKVKVGELVLDYEDKVDPTDAASSKSEPPSVTSGV